MRARLLQLGLAGLCVALAGPARAEDLSPLGRWKTIDDVTGKPKSVVLLYEEGGKLFGKIESLFVEPGADPHPKCGKCDGDRKDQPIIGMVILWNLTRDESSDAWTGGHILDPKNGKTYNCYVEPVDAGKRLKVRGFLGFALLGRTQHWLKME
jgi:uncharacterized protein (DUF2147 family)